MSKLEKDGYSALFGKRVRVTLDRGGYPDASSPAVIVEGKFLGHSDGGEFEILMDDGFVHHCWPMLLIEEIGPCVKPEKSDLNDLVMLEHNVGGITILELPQQQASGTVKNTVAHRGLLNVKTASRYDSTKKQHLARIVDISFRHVAWTSIIYQEQIRNML